MIEIYADISLTLKQKANESLFGWIDLFIHLCEEEKEMLLYIFPEEMAYAQARKCKKILFQLYSWCKDDFIHELPPLHMYVFHNILDYMAEVQNNEGFELEYKEEEDDDSSEEIIKKNLDQAEIYLLFCFEDYDFLTIPKILAYSQNTKNENLGKIVSGYENYLDLLPTDIKKLFLNACNTYKNTLGGNIKKDLNSCELEIIIENILNYLCFVFEEKGLSEFLTKINNKPESERKIHILVDALISNYCHSNNLDLSHEVETGRGRVDFKFSRGTSKVLLEIKKGSANLTRAINHQLLTYLKANQILNGYLLVFCYKKSEITKCESLLRKLINSCIKLKYVNLIKKETASVFK